ncbi:hypothetical protein PG990_006390 [Apiospora arundinis]
MPNDSKASGKKAMKATVEDEIPIQQPRAGPVPIPVAGPGPSPGSETQQTQQPQGQPVQQQTGEGSDAGLQSAGPGFNHRVTNTPGGLQVNGINPSFGQQPSLHHLPGLNNYIQSRSGPTRAGPSLYNHLPGPQLFNTPSSTSTTLFHHQPYQSLHNQNNFGVGGQPFFVNHHYYSSFVRIPSSIVFTTMADNYATGAMPNTGQHFQPPVPDTTFGPIPHVYHPRFDNGPRLVAVGTPVPVHNQSVPCACSGHMGAMPQVTPGVSTVPCAVSGPSQPTIVQTGHAVQPIGGASGQPFFAVGAPGTSGQPVLAQPAMMSGGLSAGGPSMAVPVGAQGSVFIGNGALGHIPPGAYPDIMGVGKTASEQLAETMQAGQEQGAYEPQDIKPADDDPSRMYFCRELDGTVLLRNRYTLDNIPIRWYVTTDGIFYAVRLPE